MVTPQMAERCGTGIRCACNMKPFSGRNPVMKTVETAAEKVRERRKPAASDNPFVAFQETISKQIVGALDKWRDTQEAFSEAMFLSVYGSPALQAAVGIDPQSTASRKLEMSPEYRERLQARIAELKSQIGHGGLREATIRGLLYVGMARGMVDERSLEALRRVRRSDSGTRLTLAQFKAMVREQFFMLLLDQDAALAAIPKLLPRSADERRAGLRGDPRSLVRQRRNLRRSRQAPEAGRSAIRRRYGVGSGRTGWRRPFRSEEPRRRISGNDRSDGMNVMATDANEKRRRRQV